MIGNCPHCGIHIDIIRVNCGIFRCGLYVLKNGKIKQIPPHSSKNKVKELFKKYKIYGCGNPFKYHNKKFITASWDT